MLDLSSLYNQAQQQKQQSSDKEYAPRYPYSTIFIKPLESSKPSAQLIVRLLPSVNSVPQTVAHKYYTHKVGNESIICGYSYSDYYKCPLCDSINNYKNVTGLSNISEGCKTRTMMYAQYVSSSGYVWSERYPEPKTGDIVLVLGPVGLYKSIVDTIVTQGPDGVLKLLSDNSGVPVIITRNSENRVQVAPTLYSFNSANSQQEYDELLTNLKPIEDIAKSGNLLNESLEKLTKHAQDFDRKVTEITNPTQPTAVPTNSPLGYQSLADSINNMTNHIQSQYQQVVPQQPQVLVQQQVPQQPLPYQGQPIIPNVQVDLYAQTQPPVEFKSPIPQPNPNTQFPTNNPKSPVPPLPNFPTK